MAGRRCTRSRTRSRRCGRPWRRRRCPPAPAPVPVRARRAGDRLADGPSVQLGGQHHGPVGPVGPVRVDREHRMPSVAELGGADEVPVSAVAAYFELHGVAGYGPQGTDEHESLARSVPVPVPVSGEDADEDLRNDDDLDLAAAQRSRPGDLEERVGLQEGHAKVSPALRIRRLRARYLPWPAWCPGRELEQAQLDARLGPTVLVQRDGEAHAVARLDPVGRRSHGEAAVLMRRGPTRLAVMLMMTTWTRRGRGRLGAAAYRRRRAGPLLVVPGAAPCLARRGRGGGRRGREG